MCCLHFRHRKAVICNKCSPHQQLQTNQDQRCFRHRVSDKYIAEFTVANSWCCPTKCHLIFANALEWCCHCPMSTNNMNKIILKLLPNGHHNGTFLCLLTRWKKSSAASSPCSHVPAIYKKVWAKSWENFFLHMQLFSLYLYFLNPN